MESMAPLAWGFRKHLEAAGLQTSSAGTCPLGMKWRILSKTFSWLSVFWGEKENSFCSTMQMSKFRWDTVHFPKRVYHLKMKHQTLNTQFLRDLTRRSIQGVCPLKESKHGRVLQAYGPGAQILLPFKARKTIWYKIQNTYCQRSKTLIVWNTSRKVIKISTNINTSHESSVFLKYFILKLQFFKSGETFFCSRKTIRLRV